MRISQKQNDKNSNSYYPIMSKISNFLSVTLRKRERVRKLGLKEYIDKSYEVRSGSYRALWGPATNYIIISYLLKYPLFGYKFSAVYVYVELLQLTKNKEYKLESGLDRLTKLKEILQYSNNKNLFTGNTLSHPTHIIHNFPF
jgi:hypothetical protein